MATTYPKSFARHFIGVGGVVFHQDKVLLVKLNYGVAKGRWLIPGGFLEAGETLQEGVIREVFEETGMKVDPVGLVGVRTMVRTRDHLTDLYCVLKCRLLSDPEPLVPQLDEITAVSWLPINELKTSPDVISYTRKIILNSLTGHLMQLEPPLSEERKKEFSLLKYEQYWA